MKWAPKKEMLQLLCSTHYTQSHRNQETIKQKYKKKKNKTKSTKVAQTIDKYAKPICVLYPK